MRVLVVFAHVPQPEGSAAGRCAAALLLGLREHGLEVAALAADIGAHGARAPQELGVEVVPLANEATWGSRVARYTRPRGLLGQGAFGARVRELAREVDVVHLDELDSAPAGRELPVPHSLHLHFFGRRDRDLAAPWTAEGREMLEIVRAERRAWHSTPHLVANSAEVGRDVAAAGGPAATVMPLALDLRRYQPGDPGASRAAGLLGTANWPPTANAVRRLLDEVWPRVRRLCPDAELRLAGRGMVAERFGARAGADGVTWLGEVPTADGFLRDLGVLLYPLDRGSGTKVKVLESLALGVPVVTTAAGAEGLPAGVIATQERAEELAQATAALLEDASARRALGARGRAAAERHHAPAPATAPLVRLLRRLAGDATG